VRRQPHARRRIVSSYSQTRTGQGRLSVHVRASTGLTKRLICWKSQERTFLRDPIKAVGPASVTCVFRTKADQRSGMMSITIPGCGGSVFRGESHHCSGAKPINDWA
jgi:hypothetical protein